MCILIFSCLSFHLNFQVYDYILSLYRTELIRRLKRYQIANHKCLIVKYAKDDRYCSTGLATHDKYGIFVNDLINNLFYLTLN